MAALLLSLGASACWGLADFLGGFLSKRTPAALVALIAQVTGLLVIVPVALVVAGAPAPRGLLIGLTGGLAVGAAIGCFYRALAEGTMGVVAAIVAAGALVPITWGLASGERPTALQSAGIALALTGVVAASAAPGHPTTAASGVRSIGLAVTAALLFGAGQITLAESAQTGSVLWAVGGVRAGAVLVLVAAIIVLRPQRVQLRRLAPLAGTGLLDTTAISTFALATTLGLLGIAVVFSSLYPVVTVLLARQILGERLTRHQSAGVALALAGLAVMSLAGADAD